MSPKRQRTELRVGIFIVVALVLGATFAFIIGSQRNVFAPKTTYFAYFSDVEGLRPGSPVRIAGVPVGSVTEVGFLDDGHLRVEFEVVDRVTHLIRGSEGSREGSHVIIGAKGLLGDKLLDMTVGDASLPEWNPDQPLPAHKSADIMANAERTLDEVHRTAQNLRLATDPFRDQEFSNDVKDTAQHLAKLTGMLANGDGALQRLITDPQTGDDLEAVLGHARVASDELARTARSVRVIVDDVREGDGTVHQLLYDPGGAKAVERIGLAAKEVAALLAAVREGDGTAHEIIYGDEGKKLIANLTQASADLAYATGEMRAGRGTIGGLLVDPSVYENLRRLVGELERNDILKALVRYSIKHDAVASPRPTVRRSP